MPRATSASERLDGPIILNEADFGAWSGLSGLFINFTFVSLVTTLPPNSIFLSSLKLVSTPASSSGTGAPGMPPGCSVFRLARTIPSGQLIGTAVGKNENIAIGLTSPDQASPLSPKEPNGLFRVASTILHEDVRPREFQ